MKKQIKMRPLTDEQREFAEKNHDLVCVFIKKNHLDFNEHYDELALRYMSAVQRYFEYPELQEHSFSAVANGAMRSVLAKKINKPITAEYSFGSEAHLAA